MSKENVHRFRRGVELWNRGDREAWLDETSAEWEFRTTGTFPGLKAVYRGLAGAAELWEAMRGPWENFDVSVERVEDLGERLVALVTFEVRGRDGLKTSRQWAYVVTFRDGIPTRTDNFANWEDALEAAGLSE
jgi:ketosteroid isomerase-like protein